MSDKRYQITITEKTVETKLEGREWGPVNSNPNVDFRYTPEIEKHVEVTREIFTQNVDNLDLVLVIKAINKI